MTHYLCQSYLPEECPHLKWRPAAGNIKSTGVHSRLTSLSLQGFIWKVSHSQTPSETIHRHHLKSVIQQTLPKISHSLKKKKTFYQWFLFLRGTWTSSKNDLSPNDSFWKQNKTTNSPSPILTNLISSGMLTLFIAQLPSQSYTTPKQAAWGARVSVGNELPTVGLKIKQVSRSPLSMALHHLYMTEPCTWARVSAGLWDLGHEQEETHDSCKICKWLPRVCQ
jgi:hypothetical protein